MIDLNILTKVNTINEHIDDINKIIQELYEKNVEVKIIYEEDMDGRKFKVPQLKLFKAVEHIDYSKKIE